MQLRSDPEALYCLGLPILARQPDDIYFLIFYLTLKLIFKNAHVLCLSNEIESFLLKRINHILMSIHILHGTQHTVMQINIQ